jgi:tetratricopeptide (TPR) repeat protein
MLDRARKLLREGRRDEAIGLYEKFLETHDDDLEAWLEFGLACLLNNDRKRFLQVHAMFERCMTQGVLSSLGRRARRLWNEYSRACSRVAAAAAVGTVMMLPGGFAGCRGAARQPDVEVKAEITAAEVAPELLQSEAQEPADAAVEAVAADAADGDASVSKKQKEKKQTEPPKYKTRYIAIHHLDDEDLGQ